MKSFKSIFLKREVSIKVALIVLGGLMTFASLAVDPVRLKAFLGPLFPAGPDFAFIAYAPVILVSLGSFLIYFAVSQFHPLLYENDKFPVFLKIFLGFLVMLFLILSLTRYLDNDEYEHLHNAWLMLTGTIPWFSPTMRHFPLLEWTIDLFIVIVGERVTIIQVMRLVMMAISLGSLWLVFRISLRLFQSKTSALLAVVLLVTNFAWVRVFHEIRPDIFMLFFVLLSFYCLIRFNEERRIRFLFFFVLSAILSFLGKQNAAVFYFALACIFGYSTIFLQQRVNFRNLAIMGVLVISVLWLEPVRVFLLTNIERHMLPNGVFEKFLPLGGLLRICRFNPAVFFLFLLQFFSPLNLPGPYRQYRKYVVGIPIVCFVFLFLMNMPYLQEMLVMVVFMSMAAAPLLTEFIEKLFWKARYVAICFFLLPVLLATFEGISSVSMAKDYHTTATILKISGPHDLVFDSYGKPIFRHHPLEPDYLNYSPHQFNRLKELQASGVKYLIKDPYYWSLPAETLAWFENNFEPLSEDPNVFVKIN